MSTASDLECLCLGLRLRFEVGETLPELAELIEEAEPADPALKMFVVR